jgi:hypothetical protein
LQIFGQGKNGLLVVFAGLTEKKEAVKLIDGI